MRQTADTDPTPQARALATREGAARLHTEDTTMTRETYATRIAKFIDTVRAACPNATAADCMELIRLAKRSERMNVARCNRELTEREETADERNDERARAIVAKWTGATLNCGGDPRGYAYKVILPNGAYNTWGGAESGYGVPTE